MAIKKNNKMLLLGGLAVAGAGALYMTQKCGILKPIFKNQCGEGDLPPPTQAI